MPSVSRLCCVLFVYGVGCSSPAPTSPAPEANPAAAPTPSGPPDPSSITRDDGPRRSPDGTHLAMVEIRDSLIPGAGKGLFAKYDLAAGTYVGHYDGTYLSQAEIDALDDHTTSYLFLLPECADEPIYAGIAGDLEHPISKVNFAPSTVNGHPTHLQNVDFIEQCDEPYEKLFTTRFVHAGEELYTDYGPDYPYDFMAFETVQAHFLEVAGAPAQAEFTWDYSETAGGDGEDTEGS